MPRRLPARPQTVAWRRAPKRRLAGLALCALLAAPAAAQFDNPPPIRLDGVDRLDFDRPEAWALKYFTSVSLMTGLGTPVARRPGSVDVALEGGLVPNLGEEKRRVGFIGSKVEDLNRTNLFGRLRVDVGLPRQLTLTVGFTPPVELGGVTPELFNLAIARPVLDTPSWRLGLRLHAQAGTLEGDLTCPADVAGLDDPLRNPDGCLEPSNDEVTQNYVGLELSATPKLLGERWQPHVAVSANYLDLEFQVRARYSVFLDRIRLETDGVTYSLAGGLSYRLSDKLAAAGELFYSPLDVVRDPARGSRNDELFNARLLVRYVVR